MSIAEVTRWILFVAFAWYLPGMVAARTLFRGAHPAVRLAVCWVAVPVVFSVIAVLLGVAEVDPLPFLALLAGAGVVAAVWLRAWREWADAVRSAPWVFLVPIVLGLIVAVLPPEVSLTSDTNAHIAAVRRCVEERAVFPERGFHGDEASFGVDPRFGTLHALYGVASRVTGGEPREIWHLMRGAGLALLLAGALALLTTVASSGLAVTVGLVALLATHGGVYYNILSVSAYPLWFSLGIVWALLAAAIRSGFARPVATGLLAGLTLAGLAGIHFFAFMLGGFLLGVFLLVASAAARVKVLLTLGIAATCSLPIVGIRLFTSYVNDNPIHQKVWQCMEWAPGLYSASPIFVAGWLFPFGVAALVWGAFRWRHLRDDLAYRWLMISALVALVWILVPWLLTPSMAVIGFLPLRLLMAVGGAFLLAMLLDRQRGRRRAVAIVVVLLLVPSLWQRTERLIRVGVPVVDPGRWAAMVADIEVPWPGRPTILSDPFTMLALSADAGVDVVAVPDGRSSPRDPHAIDRLRDAWRAMSPATGGERTDEILEQRRVTHVVVNTALPEGLASYEYPVHTASFEAQLSKFRTNPGRFRPLWSDEGLTVFQVRYGAGAQWNESWKSGCGAGISELESATGIGDGYRVAATARVVEDGGVQVLQVSGPLGWNGDGPAPDRQLVVRLDRAPSSVPASLAGVAKPVRKLQELFGAPRERYRWATAPGSGRCPAWLAAEVGALELDLDLRLPASVEPGEYIVTLAARDRSVFEPLRPRDLFVDDDLWRGPTIATVRVD